MNCRRALVIALCAMMLSIWAEDIGAQEPGKGDKDPYANIWSEYLASGKTFEVTLEMSRSDVTGGRPRQIWVRYDRQAGLWAGKLTYVQTNADGKDQIVESESGRTSKLSWQGGRTQGQARSISIKPRADDTAIQGQLANMGLTDLMRMLYPFPKLKQDKTLYDEWRLVSDSPMAENVRTLVYESRDQSKPQKMTYEVDFTDGFKILSTELYRAGKRVSRCENSRFEKQGGYWVPMEQVFKMFADEKVKRTIRLRIDSIALNKAFVDEDFAPKYGKDDVITDEIVGITWIAGRADEQQPSPMGHDYMKGYIESIGVTTAPIPSVPIAVSAETSPTTSPVMSQKPKNVQNTMPVMFGLLIAAVCLAGIGMVWRLHKKKAI